MCPPTPQRGRGRPSGARAAHHFGHRGPDGGNAEVGSGRRRRPRPGCAGVRRGRGGGAAEPGREAAGGGPPAHRGRSPDTR
ncbi:hypothetical protein UO65_3498 [Actinokineospora spheciospongiae]|uniref:Uncharacterized protein n=1 Tax=Actinokineospora spheciospongiae TaxID=909613 RepID=W7IWN1_9PSEU|nr:hypothetical protein UO65_3498 [Actinokineospora spheciospongiae]